MTTTADAALNYRRRGWFPVRIPRGSKGPVEPGWQFRHYDEAGISAAFAGECNVGLLLGASGLVDIDIDCDEAADLAGRYLPRTDAVTGRTGHPRRHYWYRCPEITATKRYKAPRGQKILEVRAGAGVQTVVGPSTHPEGGVYDILEAEPAEVSAEELTAAVEALVGQVVALWGQTAEVVSRPIRRTRQVESPVDHKLILRAAGYVEQMSPSISGQHGHDALFAAACALVNGFGLSPAEAESILLVDFNPRCQPPWSERDIRRKVDQAGIVAHNEPLGYLRDRDDSILDGDFDVDAWMASGASPTTPAPVMIAAESSASTVVTRDVTDWSIPAGLLDVPGLIGDVMALNLSTCFKIQRELALASAIALQAVLCGPRIKDSRDARTNMYIIAVAATAAGKDHGRVVNRRILEAAGMSQYEGASRIGSEVGLIRHVEAYAGNVLLQIDEFGKVLRAMNNPRSAPYLAAIPGTLLELYSASSSSYRGTANADVALTKVMDHPTLTILGSTVAESLYKGLKRESITDGFVPRLLIFEGLDDPEDGPKRKVEVPEQLAYDVRQWAMSQAAGNVWGVADEVADGPGVNEVWANLAANIKDRSKGGDEVTRAVWSRVEQHAGKLAMIHAASRHGAVVKRVDRESAEWAASLSSHLASRLLHRVRERVAETEYGHQCNELLDWLKRQPGQSATMTAVARAFRGYRSDERKEIVKGLVEMNLIIAERDRGKGGGAVIRAVEGGWV